MVVLPDFCTFSIKHTLCARHLVYIRLVRVVSVAIAVAALTGDMSAPARFNRPWLLLVMDFATNTTMHGIRFLAEPTKFLTRRFVINQLLHCRLPKEHYDAANIVACFYK